MKTMEINRRIDYLLKMLEMKVGEDIADLLDSHPDYQAICALLAEMDVNGYTPTFAEKMDCYNKLQWLFVEFGMSFQACLERVIEVQRLWGEV